MADKKISALTSATTPLAGTEVLPIVQSGATVKVSIANVTAGRAVSMLSGTITDNIATPVPLTINNNNPSVAAGTRVNFQYNGSTVGYVGNQFDGGDFNNLYDTSKNHIFTRGATQTMLIDNANDITVSAGNLKIGTAAKGIDFSANTHAAGMTSELLDWYEEGTWTGTLTAATPPTTPITKTGRYTRIGNQITVAIEFDNVDTTGASGAMEVTGLPFAAVSAGYGPVMKSGIGTQVIMAGIYGGFSKVIFSDAGTMSTTSIVAGAGVYLRFSATYYV